MKDEKVCRVCEQKSCIGHYQMKQSVYDNGVQKPAISYMSQSLGTWGNKWGNGDA